MKNKIIDFDIVSERTEDIEGIYHVNTAAFDGSEANVVDELRKNCTSFISFVAIIKNCVVGHILFTPARIVQNEGWTISGMGLAPLAVLPEYQGLGIGSALCMEGLKFLEKTGYPFVIVLGHPEYYPRFGFVPASNYGITCAYQDVPEEAFMIRIYDSLAMKGVTGVAYYREEFDSIT